MHSISRRQLLYGAAATAASAALTGCSSGRPRHSAAQNPTAPSASSDKGDVTTPPARPAGLNEAPTVKKMMGGKYVPLDQRLPTSPYVLPHRWVKPGKYGGTLNMVVFSTTGADVASNREFFYGFSPTRWLNDGLDVGPGSADKWSSNADATIWTIHFRTGLKWSDGVDFDVDDVLFWYEDIAVPGHDGQSVPPECVSAKGEPCAMERVDQYTLKLTYDSPQPLVPDYLAAWVKGGIGANGPSWILPKHYLKQYHPKYNKNVPKSWDVPGALWEQKADWLRNPSCPTLTGYRCKSFDNNKGVVLERNPYYYAVMPNGDQLPYIDNVVFNPVQNAQVIKLQVQQGKVDFCFGPFNQLELSDISTLSQNKEKGGYSLLLWDSGNGAADMFFFNYDYIAKDEKYGKLFRDKRFRQALSYAFDRPTAQKTLYFGTGELTTGTMSRKAIEFHATPSGPSLYTKWRDSYKKLDVAKAKSLFEACGLKLGKNGVYTFGDGSPLTIELPYSADIPTTMAARDDQLVANWKTAGIKAVRVPIPPQAFPTQWNSGQLMSHTNWAQGDGPNCLVFPDMLIPMSAAYWAPLEGQWNALTGQPQQKQQLDLPPIKRTPPRMPPEKGGPLAQLLDLYNQTKLEPDQMKRNQLVWKMFKIHIDDGPFFMGDVSNTPTVVVSKTDLRNVPTRDNLGQGGFTAPWVVPAPATYDPECWYWENPTQH